ncbi:MAG: hypothetical protein MUP70_10400 [Candidatus Aminicenantes bacterium]|nr:hypothetical protein [Candidatus Aminicenantes bacterium]
MKKTIVAGLCLVFIFCALSLTPLFGQTSLIKLKVVGELANVRIKADIGSLIIQQFPMGSLLEAVSKEGEWFQIRVEVEGGEPLTGFVHESLVTVTGAPLVETEIIKKDPLPVIPIEKEEIITEKPPVKTPPVKEKAEEAETGPPQSKKPPVTPLPLQPGHRIQVFFQLSGGGGFFPVGDLNIGARGLMDYYSHYLGTKGDGGFASLKAAGILGGDFIFPSNPRLSIFIGMDYMGGSRESLMDYSVAASARTFTVRPKLLVLPFHVGVVYAPYSFVYVKIAAEYIFANMEYFYRYSDGTFWQQWAGSASCNGPGALAAAGLLIDLTPALALTVELSGRLSRLRGFEGKDIYTDSDGTHAEEEGILYLYDGQFAGSSTFPLLFIRSRIPTEAGVFNPEQAVLNLTGISLKAGIRIRF